MKKTVGGSRRNYRASVVDCRCASFRSTLVSNVDRGRLALNRIYSTQVPFVNTEGLNCKNLLETIKAWTESKFVRFAFRRKGRRERNGGLMSFRMLKKVFPEPCKCFGDPSEGWKDNQSRELKGELPGDFLRFVDKTTFKMFPRGWDRQYVDAIYKYLPTRGSCCEASRSSGGSRSAVDLDKYLEFVSGDALDTSFGEFKFATVLSAGKRRPLTITPVKLNYLRPLHKVIYNRLRKNKWLLTGDPEPEKIRRAGFKFKNNILSGDYKSATDNLDLRVSGAILSRILGNSWYVSDNVKKLAMASLHPKVKFSDGSVIDIKRGQMMGSLLSFPLLCIYNRIVSLYSLGDVPMLINGDDLIAETSDPSRWFEILPSLGLAPEPSKTSYTRANFEINSKRFIIKGRKCERTPQVSVKVLLNKDLTGKIASTMKTFCERAMSLSLRAGREFLTCHRDIITKCLYLGVDARELCFRGEKCLAVWRSSDLLNIAYRQSLLFARPTPFPELNQTGIDLRRCSGVISEPRKKDNSRILFSEYLQDTMTEKQRADVWWKLVEEGGIPSPAPIVREKVQKMMVLPVRNHIKLSFGNLIPRRKFQRRFFASFLKTPQRSELVHTSVFNQLSQNERLGHVSFVRASA